MSELVFLGSGTSNGVPMLGVRYPNGYLDNPKNHRTRSSVLVIGPTGNLLVDAAPELRLQMVREGIYEVEAMLLTHAHADHIMGMDDLRSLCIVTGQPVEVYAQPEHQQDVRRIFPYAFGPSQPGVAVPRFNLHDVPAELEVGGLTYQTFLVKHGRIDVVAFRVNGLAYMTDVNAIPDAAWPFLEDLEVLILDAVRRQPHPNHFHFDAAIEVSQKIAAKRAILTHLGHDYDHDADSRDLPSGVEFAFDGLRVPL